MQKEVFFQHLCEELRQNRDLYPYYKLVDGSNSRREFRKAYFLQRLDYLDKHIDFQKNPKIWDCGCGYGTTGLFLAMNGITSYGTTLEFYMKQLEKRRQFWDNFGDTTLFTCEYANVFDQQVHSEQYDYIILQDTLHHLEPLPEALKIFYNALKTGGKLILLEENGSSWVKKAILFAQRGNKRVISVYDDVLNKEVLMGNENIRSEKTWRKAFQQANFKIDEDSVQYIRCLAPHRFNGHNMLQNIDLEQLYWQKRKWFCRYAFFGLNMIFTK